MRLEILVGKGEPKTYVLNKPRVLIGSGEGCDIILDAPTISRKHIILLEMDGSYFASDQGSTNGSYLNDVRLVPGMRTEILSFLPLRLGTDVLITLVLEEVTQEIVIEELQSNPPVVMEATSPKISLEDQTRVISLRSLSKTKTDQLVKRKERIKKKGSAVERKRERIQSFAIACFTGLILGVSYYLHTSNRAAANQSSEFLPRIPKIKSDSLVRDLPSAPTGVETFPHLLSSMSCSSEREKLVCNHLDSKGISYLGVVQVGSTLNLMLSRDKFSEEAQELLSEYEGVTSRNDFARIATLVFIRHVFQAGLEMGDLVNLSFVFAFFTNEEGPEQYKLDWASAIKGQKLQELMMMVKDAQFEGLRRIGAVSFSYTHKFLDVYYVRVPEESDIYEEVAPELSAP